MARWVDKYFEELAGEKLKYDLFENGNYPENLKEELEKWGMLDEEEEEQKHLKDAPVEEEES